jgi:hypothetical protein
MGLIRGWDPWDYTEVIRVGWVALQKSKTKNLILVVSVPV